MSRGFFGGLGGGGGNSGGSKGGMLGGGFGGGKGGGIKASDVMKKNMMKNGMTKSMGSNKHDKPSYNDMMKNRIEQYKNQMMTEARGGQSVHLPGTDPSQTRELSESAKEIIRQMAEKKAKKDAKREKLLKSFRDTGDGKKKKDLSKPMNFLGASFGGSSPDLVQVGDGRGPRDDDDRR